MIFYVKKIEWEYGEKYGHVFYPENMEMFEAKLQALEKQAIDDEYPFYVEVFCTDGSYIGFIVGHELSCFNFGIPMSNGKLRFDCHYDPKRDNDKRFIEYYFKASLSEGTMPVLLSNKLALKAVYQYIEIQKFPSYIQLNEEEFINKYICFE